MKITKTETIYIHKEVKVVIDIGNGKTITGIRYWKQDNVMDDYDSGFDIVKGSHDDFEALTDEQRDEIDALAADITK